MPECPVQAEGGRRAGKLPVNLCPLCIVPLCLGDHGACLDPLSLRYGDLGQEREPL